MPAQQTFQARKFGAGSTVTLSTKGGAVLGGVWISTKGTTPQITVYDAVASVTGSDVIPTTTIGAVGKQDFPAMETGTGLTVKTASCTGTLFWRPSQAGGA